MGRPLVAKSRLDTNPISLPTNLDNEHGLAAHEPSAEMAICGIVAEVNQILATILAAADVHQLEKPDDSDGGSNQLRAEIRQQVERWRRTRAEVLAMVRGESNDMQMKR